VREAHGSVSFIGSTYHFEMRERTDRWRGRQPLAEKLVYLNPSAFGLLVRAPDGEHVVIRLGPDREDTAADG
jgi:hypothetical protein